MAPTTSTPGTDRLNTTAPMMPPAAAARPGVVTYHASGNVSTATTVATTLTATIIRSHRVRTMTSWSSRKGSHGCGPVG